MLNKLAEINVRFEEISEKLTLPDVVSDQKKFADLSKQYKDLEPVVLVYKEYKLILENIDSSKEILSVEEDPEMKEMAKMEIEELLSRKHQMDEEIKVLLIPKFWLNIFFDISANSKLSIFNLIFLSSILHLQLISFFFNKFSISSILILIPKIFIILFFLPTI